MSDARKIIDYAMDDDAKEMREALYASIYDRVTQAFEQKRVEVAGSLLGMPLSTESVEIDEDDETIYLEDYALEDLEEFVMSEDFDELDEDSKSIILSHIDEAKYGEEKEEGHEDEAEDKAMCKDVAKKEVKKHEKNMHGEEVELDEVSDATVRSLVTKRLANTRAAHDKAAIPNQTASSQAQSDANADKAKAKLAKTFDSAEKRQTRLNYR
jgi:hypothetical protein